MSENTDFLNGLIIRLMQETDLDQVAEIESKYFSLPWSRQAFLDSLKLPHTLYLVAEIGGKVVGYCGCYQILEEAEIVNVAVDVPYRKQGVGRKMLEELIRLGEKRGAFAHTLEVRVSNEAAIRLYESLGFETIGIRKNFYEKPTEDAKIMWKRWQVS